MSGPAFEFAEGVTYEEAIADLAGVLRQRRDDARPPGAAPLPGDVARSDQFAAAHEDALESIHAMGAAGGHSVTEEEMTDDVMARCTVAWLACHACPHIKGNPAQRQVALLAVHRLVCERCIKTVVKPPAENDDRCDWCLGHGHTDFWPIRMSWGPAVLMGDACDDCNAKLKAGSEQPADG